MSFTSETAFQCFSKDALLFFICKVVTHIYISLQEAATNALREALRSFGCHFTGKANESADVAVESGVLETSLQMDKHGMTRTGRTHFYVYALQLCVCLAVL
jgi:hypothetical protein